MKIYYCLSVIVFLFFSCSETKQGELLEIPVDTNPNRSLPLSEIAEKITAVALELTGESLINPDQIERIIFSEDYVIIAEFSKILVFDKKGKFIRSIASRGVGPGEYNHIQNLAVDEKSKRLFIISNSPTKIMCYDTDGNFLKERRTDLVSFGDINYINGKLLLVSQQTG